MSKKENHSSLERIPRYRENSTEKVPFITGPENTGDGLVEVPGMRERKEIDEGIETTKVAEAPPIPLVPEDEDTTPPKAPDTDGTPLEWRAKLRALIEGGKATFDRYTSFKEELLRRSSELDAQAEKIGKVEDLFRSIGERYNKYGWKTKLAVGASLGVGAAAFSTVSLPAAIACMSGIAAQRVAGMASMYLKFEKGANHGMEKEEKFWRWCSKEKAMMKAMLYTVAMGVAIKEGIELASESSWGDAVHEWLRHHYPFSHTEALAQNQVRGTIVRPEVHGPMVTAVSTPEMPSVAATPGHGYEYMAKRLWEQLQEKHLDPTRYPQGSDIRKLLEANAGSINKVVHQIALKPQHGFFHPDGSSALSSVLIHSNAHMTINAAGQIHMMDNSINAVKAPEGMLATPAYHPTEAPVHVESPPIVHEHVTPPSPKVYTAPVTEAPAYPHPTEIHTTQNGPVARVAPIVDHEIITNRFNLQIPVAEAHVYAGPDAMHTFVYGGSSETQADAIQRYLTLHPNRVVYGTDVTDAYRIPFHLLGGKVTAGPPVRTNGFLGFFSSWMKAPRPNDLKRLIQ